MAPATPPAACNIAKKAMPPNNVVRKAGFMKILPIITPAVVVETKDTKSKVIMLNTCLSRLFLYPTSLVRMSKTMLAAVKPKNCVEYGLSAKVMIVAIIPVMVTAPNFLTHHKTRMNAKTPKVSQKNGRCVAFQKIGAT